MDKKIPQSTAYYRANREACAATARAWRAANPGKGPTREQVRRSKLKMKYGITLEQFNEMLIQQGHKCAICHTTTPLGSKQWDIDHCHRRNVVRGVLCHLCNMGLGAFRENAHFLSHGREIFSGA